MISVRTVILYSVLMLPVGIVVAQDSEQPFDHAQSSDYYNSPVEFVKVMERQGTKAVGNTGGEDTDIVTDNGLILTTGLAYDQVVVAVRGGMLSAQPAGETRLRPIGTGSAEYLTSAQVEMLPEARKFTLEPNCIDMAEGAECWKEITDRPGCHIWDTYLLPTQTVTWSGSCDTDGIAVGRGTAEWHIDEELLSYTGALASGKKQGHTVMNVQHLGEVYEGRMVDDKFDGYWVRRGTRGEEWICFSNDEQADASACGVIVMNRRKMTKGHAVLRSGPGDEYESLGSVDRGEDVLATVRIGERMRVETSNGLWGFVHSSKLAGFPAPADVEKFRDCEGCPHMVTIPAGTFMMGSPMSEEYRDGDEGPRHRVKIRQPFAVGIYEVTFDEWDICVSDDGCMHHPHDQGWGRGDRPVINVSWEDAKEYVEWLSGRTGKQYRLLSEAEWEYVARAGTTGPFHFGSTISTDLANYDGYYTYGMSSKGEYRERTVPVGSFPANDFGLHDIHGNVWEWVEDCWHDSYDGAPSDGSAWTLGGNCEYRELRGGSWYSRPGSLRSANRVGVGSGSRYMYGGFRVARAIAP